jgi:hypothetical protein
MEPAEDVHPDELPLVFDELLLLVLVIVVLLLLLLFVVLVEEDPSGRGSCVQLPVVLLNRMTTSSALSPDLVPQAETRQRLRTKDNVGNLRESFLNCIVLSSTVRIGAFWGISR